MWKSLAYKELRECGPLAAVALVLSLLVVADSVGLHFVPYVLPGYSYYREPIPFANSLFVDSLRWVLAGLAISLGVRQTFWEAWQGTEHVYWHLPLRRPALIGIKLAAGLTLYLAAGAAPILVFAAWATAEGTHASPFLWGMTAGAWRLLGGGVLIYLGTLLAGLRPFPHTALRIAPVVAALAIAVALTYQPLGYLWPWCAGAAGLLLLLGIVTATSRLELA